MDQGCRGYWPPVAMDVPQNFIRNTSQNCGMRGLGLLSGAYQPPPGLQVVSGLGAARPDRYVAFASLMPGLGGLGDVCSTLGVTSGVTTALSSILSSIGLATSGGTGGDIRQVGRGVSAGTDAFGRAVAGACTPASSAPPAGAPGGPSTYELQLQRALAEQQMQVLREQGKSALEIQKQKTNTILLVAGGAALALGLGYVIFTRKKRR